ncbi:MAG TPA: hypothetical protein VH814_11685 [Steroidobacteraceae bacterium]|jgi:hypothetical protein
MRHIYVCGLLAAAATAQADDYRPPRLANGQIDLQGVWAHKNLTPLERPDEAKSFVLSRAEAAKLTASIMAEEDDPARPNEPAEYLWDRTIEPIRGEYHSSVITDPADGKIPGNERFKELAQAFGMNIKSAFDGPEVRPTSERCVGSISAAPPASAVPASDLRQIMQTAHSIVIFSEENHEARVIRMNAEHVPAAVVSWLGDSIGWWEGATLVIETKYFAPSSAERAGPHSLFFVGPGTTVTERITRLSADELSYAFAVEDPTLYTRPWKGETRFTRSDEQILEYACHEGNYSLRNALMSARQIESGTVAKQP